MKIVEKLDANEQVFLQRQLEHIKSQTYDIKYPELKARKLFPVNFDAGPGVKVITYRQYDMTGMAKVISWADTGKDLPRAGVGAREFPAQVKALGASYGYNLFDVQFAQRQELDLDSKLATAAKRAIQLAENRIAFDGDADYNLQGFFSNPNIPSASVPNDGSGGLTVFTSKSADQIIRDLNACVNAVYENSSEVEVADTLAMPPEQYAYISSLRVPDLNTTVKKFFMENNDFIKEIIPCAQLRGKGTGGTDVMFAYRRSPDVLTLEIPVDFYQRPVQEIGLEYIVNCIENIGGVLVYAPLAINISEGI